MATTVKAPREWEQMDPNEQYAAAVEAAQKELDTGNVSWRKGVEQKLATAAEKHAREEYNRVELVLRRVGYTLATLLGVAVAGFFIWLPMTNYTDIARDRAVRGEWITRCSVGGGSVYQSASSGSGEGPLLCVVGGKVVQVP